MQRINMKSGALTYGVQLHALHMTWCGAVQNMTFVWVRVCGRDVVVYTCVKVEINKT
eukprot:m.91749 g.91749  ORF g.91749 m.91749 type:complete len:57 (-) comp12959_c0_seq1:686-856(-)